MNNITHLYGNGCSFMKDHAIIDNGDPLYLQLIAEHHGWSWENQAEPGCCNRRIIRTAARDALHLGPETLMIISLTFWGRTELYSSTEKFGIEEWHTYVKPGGKHDDYWKIWLRYADENGEISNLCADLVMFTSMLKLRKIKYFIYCHSELSTNDMSFFEQSQFGQTLLADPGVLNIFSNSLCQTLGPGDWFYDGYVGHFSAQGHQQAAKILINLIDERV